MVKRIIGLEKEITFFASFIFDWEKKKRWGLAEWQSRTFEIRYAIKKRNNFKLSGKNCQKGYFFHCSLYWSQPALWIRQLPHSQSKEIWFLCWWCNDQKTCSVWLISWQVPAKGSKKHYMARVLIVDGLPIGCPQFDTAVLNLTDQSFIINCLILQAQRLRIFVGEISWS